MTVFTTLRRRTNLPIVVAALLLAVSCYGQATDSRQIHWQRNLADAHAIAKATGRPLLIALNMDGESASDRIVHENYRDPAFVAATRKCVCVVGSVFRHNQRDYDDEGRRIPCPRLGCVTCGEHMALEPALFETYLSDGERVAPRHALVRSIREKAGAEAKARDKSLDRVLDKTLDKAFDISLSFDLHDIDRALLGAVAGLPEPDSMATDGRTWSELAIRRDHYGRRALESNIARLVDLPAVERALRAVARLGDAGSVDALRPLVARWAELGASGQSALVAAARSVAVERRLGTSIHDQLARLDGASGLPAFHDSRLSLLSALAQLDIDGAATRRALLGYFTLAESAEAVTDALHRSERAEEANRLRSVLYSAGGSLEFGSLLRLVASRTGPEPARTLDPPLPAADELLARLERLDAQRAAEAATPAQDLAFAEATLQLARRKIEAGSSEGALLLGDAESAYARALERTPNAARAWLERARCAYLRSAHAEQVEHGRRALRAETGLRFAQIDIGDDLSEVVVEAMRWIGDGSARLLEAGAASAISPASEDKTARELELLATALRALGLAAGSPFCDANDLVNLSSFCRAAGLRHEAFAIAATGVRRFPAAQPLRQQCDRLLWGAGRVDLGVLLAESVAATWPESPDAAWYAGYARIVTAEAARRAERPALADLEYATAVRAFTRVSELRPEYAANSSYWRGVCWLGRGLAAVRRGARVRAAECLVAALETGADLREVRDGLGYDVLDLVDKILEWRDSGPSAVTPDDLSARIQWSGAKHQPFYQLAVSDSALREALRADGRNPVRTERRTVDARGDPVTMLIGVPCAEGDRLLAASLEAARMAIELAEERDGAAVEEAKRVLAQSATIQAERLLERKRIDGVFEALSEALTALDYEPLDPGVAESVLRERAAALREQLGEARPKWRLGR